VFTTERKSQNRKNEIGGLRFVVEDIYPGCVISIESIFNKKEKPD
jgi:hypothetical protein